MIKHYFLLFVGVLASILVAQGQELFTGNEWIVNSYKSAEGAVVSLKLPTNLLNKSLFIKNEKGKFVKSKPESFWNEANDFLVLPVETTNKKSFLPISRNGQTYFLLIGDQNYCSYMENRGIYDDLIQLMNDNYSYLKRHAPIAIISKDIPLLYDMTYPIKWKGYEFTPNASTSGNRYNISFTYVIGDNAQSGKIKIQNIQGSYFWKKEAIEKKREEIRQQYESDLQEDHKPHAFTVAENIVSPYEIEKGDTIYLYNALSGYLGQRLITLTADQARYYLRSIIVPGKTASLGYPKYFDYIARRERAGEAIRIQVAKQADSIASERYLALLKVRVTTLQNELIELRKKANKNQTILSKKDYAFGDYGECGLDMTFYNCYKKTIKYINFEVRAYNQFGDPQADWVGKRVASGRCIGPIDFEDTASYSFNSLFYDKNNVISRMCVTKLTITFIDNSVVTISDVNKHIGESVHNMPR